MSKAYDDPRFGVEQCYILPETGAINGTVGATELYRHQVNKAMVVNSVRLRIKVGGTEASIRTLILNTSLAGTGAAVAIGTQTLGTLANNTFVTWAVTGSLAAGDALILQHLGTGAAVYNVQPQVFLQETFA